MDVCSAGLCDDGTVETFSGRRCSHSHCLGTAGLRLGVRYFFMEKSAAITRPATPVWLRAFDLQYYCHRYAVGQRSKREVIGGATSKKACESKVVTASLAPNLTLSRNVHY